MTRKLVPAVFLDRDGVLCRTFVRNAKPYAPTRLEDFKLMPYSHHSIFLLKKQGYMVLVITNQPDIGNGHITFEIVESMHNKIREKTMVDDFFLCPHRQDEGCECRKPKPGMLFAAAAKHEINLSKSFMIGDRWSDIEAGEKAGCRTIFIDRHYAEPRPINPEATVSSLRKAVKYILTNY